MRETWVGFLGWEDHLEEGMGTHSSILAWRIPWTEEAGGLWSTGSQRVGLDWATNTFTFFFHFLINRKHRDATVSWSWINTSHPSLFQSQRKGNNPPERSFAVTSIHCQRWWNRQKMTGGAYLVSLAHRILQPSLGITKPRCIRSLQFVGPVCGHTWVPGCIMEYLICTENVPPVHPLSRFGRTTKLKPRYKITVNFD